MTKSCKGQTAPLPRERAKRSSSASHRTLVQDDNQTQSAGIKLCGALFRVASTHGQNSGRRQFRSRDLRRQRDTSARLDPTPPDETGRAEARVRTQSPKQRVDRGTTDDLEPSVRRREW